MEVDFAFLCDYADASGKLTAVGIGFDQIFAPQVPCTHGLMHVVAQLRASVAEEGTKQLTLRFLDADGADVIPAFSADIEVRSPVPGSEATARFNCGLPNVTFEKYGDYAIHILIDGNEMQRIPFAVVSPPSTG